MNFLEQTARTVYANHGPRLDDVWVILPTRRAVTVFLEYLAAQSERPFLAPHTLAIDDFIMQAAGVQLIDPVSLLFDLYEVFREIDEHLDFEPFIGWASVLLADFDRIDQYLVKPSYLFDYLTAAKALERWQASIPEGASIAETTGTARYFQLFENLHAAYQALHARLDAQGLVYRGMGYRRLAEQVETLIRDNMAYEKLYFVGFNALSRAEEHIIKVLLEAKKAELFWDADAYYMNDWGQEAGEFLRRYRENGWLFTRDNREQIGNHLLGTPKNVQIIGVPTASMQAKVAGELCKGGGQGAESEGLGAESREHRAPGPTPNAPGSKPSAPDSPLHALSPMPYTPGSMPAAHSPKTAVVLADETLLVPVLYALDESVKDLNVTMGLSLRNSLLFTLVDGLFEMQRTVHEFRTRDGRDLRIPKFHHKHVIKILNHPFVRQYERIRGLMSPDEVNELPKPLFSWIVEKIVSEQRAYLTEAEMLELGQHDPLVTVLFTRWPNDQPRRVIELLYDLIDQLRAVYRETQDAIEIEYLYLFYTLLKQLETTLEREQGKEGAMQVTLRSFRQFLYELIRQTTIPFTSEGNSHIQVMGMLETRGLDFDRVIILSANEGILPQTRKLNSLIPFDISTAPDIKLPTYREQEAVMAYHFYRLLQRAKDITLLYTTSPDAYGMGKGERSRYIRQLEYELIPRSGQIKLTYPAVRIGKSYDRPPINTDWQIAKTGKVMESLLHNLTEKGLYPTALNQFVDCTLKYYFARVVGVGEEDDLEEKMGVAEFGSWLHLALETLDKDFRMLNKPVTEDIVQEVLETTFKDVMRGRVMESGLNLLMYQTAQELMLNFQRRQAELTGLEVLGTEQKLETTIEVLLPSGPIRVKVAGKIDRIEKYNGQIRIVDYKTGTVKLPGDRAMDQAADKLPVETGSDWGKARQLWLYKYLYLKSDLNRDNLPVTAGFYSFRDKDGALKTNTVRFSEGETPETYVHASEAVLAGLIQKILDPEQPFVRTSDLKTCAFCSYKRICGRE